MKILKTPALYLVLIAVVLSCSFSTTGTASKQQNNPIQDNPSISKPISIKPIDTSRYTVAKKLTPLELAKRDSILKYYIGSIVKPYVEDLKESNNKNVSSLIGIIRAQNSKMDSLDLQRQKESRFFDLNSASRDSLTQALILKDKTNDSLKKVISKLDRVDRNTTDIISTFAKISGAISIFGTIMLIVMCLYGFINLILSTAIYFKTRKNNNLSKYHAQ